MMWMMRTIPFAAKIDGPIMVMPSDALAGAMDRANAVGAV